MHIYILSSCPQRELLSSEGRSDKYQRHPAVMRHVNVCLLPAEILRDIFAASRKDSDFRATTATLARTCRTLKEPALDALWKNIIGFKPLLSCLPNGIVVRTSKRKKLVNEVFQI
jgi:hypothetical protein